MARRAQPAGQPDDDQAGGHSDADQLARTLATLGDDAELVIYRDEPTHAAGYLATWPLGSDDSPVSLVERLQAEFGGRVFRLQPVARVGGKKQFVKGGVRVRVAGEPRGVAAPSSSSQPQTVVVESPARAQPRSESTMMGPVVDVLQKLAERLGAVEARLASPQVAAPAVPSGPGIDLLAELRKVAELRKLARELVGDDEDDDEDDDEEEEEPPRTVEDRLFRMVEKHIDKLDEKPAASSSSSSSTPRLIRNGVDVTPTEADRPNPPSSSAPRPSSSSSSDEEESGAVAVARKIAELGPERAVAFLFEVQAALPDEVKSELARIAGLAQGQAVGG